LPEKNSMNNNICHDCQKNIEIAEDGRILDGRMLKYALPEGKEKVVFKCAACYEKNKGLANYQETEVYSRVVGYLRPVGQFNQGKQQEYRDRKEYKIKKEA
jgi:hypothetical protein